MNSIFCISSLFFFFKQKTAYEMRISDWSSDVCSSDLSTKDVTPLARVPWLEPGIIMKMLDAGTYGIICPMINSREEAEKLVGACKYAPIGYRSFAGARNSLYGGPG